MTVHAEARDTRPPVREMPVDVLLQYLTGITKSVLGLETMNEKVGLDTNFFDLGIDSMNVIDLVLAIEQELAVQFTEEDLSAELFVRAESLVTLIRQRSQK
jgi:acyl carrier protein